MSGLTLVYGGVTVNLRQFSETNWPRRRIDTPTQERTAFGTPVERGTAFEPPHLWQVSAAVSDRRETAASFSDLDNLEGIYNRWQIIGGDIILHDYSRDFSEPSPRTRPLATGGAAVTVGAMVRYPAQFRVRFQGELTLNRQSSTGLTVLVGFQLIEGIKLVTT
jgi:hypothetical protein